MPLCVGGYGGRKHQESIFQDTQAGKPGASLRNSKRLVPINWEEASCKQTVRALGQAKELGPDRSEMTEMHYGLDSPTPLCLR